MAFDVSLYEQAALFVYALLIGVLIGAIYDVFRIVRIALTGGRGSYSTVRFERIEALIIKAGGQRTADGHNKKSGLSAGLEYAFVFACDVLFFVFTSLVSVVFLYQANYGQPRLYVFVCAVLGFVAYYNTVGRMVTYTAGAIFSLFRLITVFLIYRLVAPVIKATQRAISVPIETLKARLITDLSDAYERKFIGLCENWFGYSGERSKKEGDYENGHEKDRYDRQNRNNRSGFVLHRKNRQLQNRVFGPKSTTGNDTGKNRLLFRRG